MTQVAITRAPDQFRLGVASGVATPTCCCCCCLGTTVGAAIVLPQQVTASARRDSPGEDTSSVGRVRRLAGAALTVLALPAGLVGATLITNEVSLSRDAGLPQRLAEVLGLAATVTLLLVLLSGLVAGARRTGSYARLVALCLLLCTLFCAEIVAFMLVLASPVLGAAVPVLALWPLQVALMLALTVWVGRRLRAGLPEASGHRPARTTSPDPAAAATSSQEEP